MVSAQFANRFDARAASSGQVANQFDARAVVAPSVPNRFDARRTLTGQVPNRFDARRTLTGQVPNRFDARRTLTGQVPNRFDARNSPESIVTNRFDARRSISAGNVPNRHASLYPVGWHVYARDLSDGSETLLGFIAEDDDPKTLADVSIADGEYEIFILYQSLFWSAGRDGKRLTIDIDSGEVDSSRLPAIGNLRREIWRGTPRLRWNIHNEYDPPSGIEFGVWIAGSTPVDTTGTPDYVVPYFSGQADYYRTYSQTTNQYAAVAAKTEDATGPVSEIQIIWSTTAPGSPPNQLADKG